MYNTTADISRKNWMVVEKIDFPDELTVNAEAESSADRKNVTKMNEIK